MKRLAFISTLSVFTLGIIFGKPNRTDGSTEDPAIQQLLDKCRQLTTPKAPLPQGVHQVTISQVYQFTKLEGPSNLQVEEILEGQPFVAETRFQNSLLSGNRPGQELTAMGTAYCGKPLVYVQIKNNPSQTKSGFFAVSQGHWQNPPPGWIMLETKIKGFRVDQVEHYATPIQGFAAKWGAFWAGNNSEFDHHYRTSTSSKILTFELWVKYDD